MLLLKYLLMIAGLALFGSAAGVVGYDVWVATQLQRLLRRRIDPADAATGEASRSTELSGASAVPRPLRAQLAGKIFGLGLVLLLFSAGIVVIPDGYAGVRISQLSGVLPQTLYPGVHLVVPLMQRIETYDVREDLYQTSAVASILHKGGELLTVQAREGAEIILIHAIETDSRARAVVGRLPFFPHPSAVIVGAHGHGVGEGRALDAGHADDALLQLTEKRGTALFVITDLGRIEIEIQQGISSKTKVHFRCDLQAPQEEAGRDQHDQRSRNLSDPAT